MSDWKPPHVSGTGGGPRKPLDITYEAVEKPRRPFPWLWVLAAIVCLASYASDTYRAHDCMTHGMRWIQGGACSPDQCVPK